MGKVRDRADQLRSQRGLTEDTRRWPVTLDAIQDSGVFRQSREMALHSLEFGDGERLVGFALSEARLSTLLDAGVSEEEIGLDELRAVAAEIPRPETWWLSYRVFPGLK